MAVSKSLPKLAHGCSGFSTEDEDKVYTTDDLAHRVEFIEKGVWEYPG